MSDSVGENASPPPTGSSTFTLPPPQSILESMPAPLGEDPCCLVTHSKQGAGTRRHREGGSAWGAGGKQGAGALQPFYRGGAGWERGCWACGGALCSPSWNPSIPSSCGRKLHLCPWPQTPRRRPGMPAQPPAVGQHSQGVPRCHSREEDKAVTHTLCGGQLHATEGAGSLALTRALLSFCPLFQGSPHPLCGGPVFTLLLPTSLTIPEILTETFQAFTCLSVLFLQNVYHHPDQ